MDSSSIMDLASICLIMFALTGMIDGSYWHLMKLKLHTVPESRYEHYTHTVRMLVFPFILFFLYTSNYGGIFLWAGIVAVIIDLGAMMADLLAENDSRKRWNGLPKWEYYIHVIANGFHFASLALVFASKPIEAYSLSADKIITPGYSDFTFWIAWIFMPGAIINGIVHLWLCQKKYVIHKTSS